MHYATDGRQDIARHPGQLAWRTPLAWSLVSLVWSYALLTNFDLQPLAVEKLDLVYNDMARKLLAWDFTVDREYIQWETFERAGKTYAYFNVLPALFRIPAVWAGTWDVHMAQISCAAALWLGALCNLRLMQRAGVGWLGMRDGRLVLTCA